MVYADNKRRDGTYNIKIRITHNQRNLKISTNLYAEAKDLTKSLKIKSRDYIDQTDDLIRKWRGIVSKLGVKADHMDVKQIADHIKDVEKHGDVFRLNFIEYGRVIAARKGKGSEKNYLTAINALSRFVEKDSLDVSEITPNLLSEFERFLEDEPVMRGDAKTGTAKTKIPKSKAGGRAISLYLGSIRHIHNQAKEEFNDETHGVIKIPQSPFKRHKVKKQPRVKKKALPMEMIQAIINLPDVERVFGPGSGVSRRDLARDCALLSFGLAGMNAADLYDCEIQKHDKGKNVIVYKRKKTRRRRDDEAEMQIRIEPCISGLVRKYMDPAGERLFVFHKLYSTNNTFNSALKAGFDKIEEDIKSEKHITFYAFRHTWATIARSDELNIDKYTVHEALNHVDVGMKNTDIYIDRDYRPIWRANAKVLELFDWAKKED